MAKIFDKVSPGDLITAELMNRLLEAVEGLDERLAALETATKGSISGTVKDAATNNPIAGAIVRALLGNITHTSPPTDNQGRYTITELLPGDYLLSAAAANYIDSAIQTVSVVQGSGRIVNFILTSATGLVVVPKLFGLSLSQAKSTLISSAIGLVPGEIITTVGERILPENLKALEMVVLNQVPDAGEVVQSGSTVDIVIAALPKSENGGNGTPNHKVTGMNPPSSIGARAGQEISVIGENFVTPLNKNRVSFDREVVLPKAGSTSEELRVIVPKTLTGLPRSVTVCVEINGISRCLPESYPILKESSTPELIITATDPPLATIGYPCSLIGTGFDTTPANNKITFSLVTDPTKKYTVIPDTVNPEGERMTINSLGPFPDNMKPSQFGTSYQIELMVANNTAKFQISIASI